MSIIFNPGEPINNGLQTANNGLKVNPAGNAQLGGPIVDLTVIPLYNAAHPLVFQTVDSLTTPTKQTTLFLQGGGTPTVIISASDPTFVNPDIQNTINVSNSGTTIQSGVGATGFVQIAMSKSGGIVIRDTRAVPVGLKYGSNYDATLIDDSLVPKRYLGVYLTPLSVDDSLGIFTNADCNAAAPTAGIGQLLQGLTVMYQNISPNTWVNYPYTACL